MPTVVNLRPILDRKQWEMCNYSPTASVSASFVVSSSLLDQYQFAAFSSNAVYVYDPINDGWMNLPNPAMSGTFGPGSCGARHPFGPRGLASAGTTTTLTTALNLQRVMKGYKIRIVAGPNAGNEYTIKTNTTGANSIITIEGAAGTAFTSASEFIMITGRFFFLNAGTQASGSFKLYCLALNTWLTCAFANLPATIATEGRLIATPSIYGTGYVPVTAVASSTTTVVTASGTTWATNNWANYQIRIVAGTGAGQFRPIASNTATTITVSTAWTTTPDSTSTFVVEGNDDNLYFMGNAAVTMYRYSILNNAWTVLAPAAARTGAPQVGMSGHWVSGVTNDQWVLPANYLNGQYLYSFRGGSSAVLDRYSISANTWESDINYAPKAELMISGSGYSYTDDHIYIMLGNSGRMLRYNIAEARIEANSQLWYGQGSTIQGDRLFDVSYVDGTTKLRWMYYMTHGQTTLFRTLLF